MIVLIDTNILLDFLLKRELYYKESKEVLMACTHNNEISGLVAMHSINDLWYMLRGLNDINRRKCIRLICIAFRVCFTNHKEVLNQIENKKFKDFEDSIVESVAYVNKADYIITRNTKDYKYSRVEAVTPKEFISKFKIKRDYYERNR